jgi:hypothetical protein
VSRRSFDMLAAGETSPRRMEPLAPASDAVASDCLTKLENARGTEFGEASISVASVGWPSHWPYESVSKPDGIVFRCRLRGRRLEFPAWVFDRSRMANSLKLQQKRELKNLWDRRRHRSLVRSDHAISA